jgi:hypothetical protein
VIATSAPRSDRRIALERLLAAAADAVDMVATDSVGAPLPILALATRNVFELNLRSRFITESDDNLRSWLGELLIDRIQLYEAILKLDGRPDLRATIQFEIDRNRAVAQKHAIDVRKTPMRVPELARVTAMLEEYDALFKFYSKLVHPTSYLVNGPESEVGSLTNRNILLIKLQAYGHEMLERAHTWSVA